MEQSTFDCDLHVQRNRDLPVRKNETDIAAVKQSTSIVWCEFMELIEKYRNYNSADA